MIVQHAVKTSSSVTTQDAVSEHHGSVTVLTTVETLLTKSTAVSDISIIQLLSKCFSVIMILQHHANTAITYSNILVMTVQHVVKTSSWVCLHHIIVSDISLKTRNISVVESLGISSTTFTQCAPNAVEFAGITQNNSHYAVQGHSRSPIFVPIERSYATSYQ